MVTGNNTRAVINSGYGTLTPATAVAFRLNEVTRVLGIIKFAFTKPKFKFCKRI